MIASKIKYISLIARNTALKIARFKYLIYTLSLLLVLTISFRANAQEAGGRLDLTVSPPVIELTAKPGDVINEKFRVRNNSSEPIILQIDTRRLISDPTEGNPIPEEQAQGEELEWVSFDRPEFTANPLEWQDITFTINIPKDAAYGYYFVFRITPKDSEGIITTGASIQGEILVVTLLNVLKDGALSKTQLFSFKPKNAIFEYLPAEFLVKLKNLGNVHVKPRGNIFITRGGEGQEIGILEVNPGIGSILPGGTREFTATWNDGFIERETVMEGGEIKLDDNGNPVTKLKINWNKLTSFRIGPYEAKLLMVYDDGSKDVTIEGSTTFWVIPYTALGIALLVIIITIIILRYMLKAYIGRAIKRGRAR